MMQRMLTFDDVALQPQYNEVNSRSEPFLGSRLTNRLRVGTPLLASGMETVIGDKLADVLVKHHSYPIFHRFAPVEKIAEWIEKYNKRCVISWGVTDNDGLKDLIMKSTVPPAAVCFDVAHGHSLKMRRAIETFKGRFPGIDVIAGAVCTERGYYDLARWGADAVRVGIGPGSSCTTRSVTGFGAPQFSAIRACAETAKQIHVPIIADGGIRNSRDCVLALAAGADTVMLGKLFAACTESAAEKAYSDGKMIYSLQQEEYSNYHKVALYKGQASATYQKEGRMPEGEEGWIPVTGSASNLISDLESCIKSGLVYAGARSIEELQRNAVFVEVTHSYHDEMSTRF